MSARIIDGKAIAARVRDEVAREVQAFSEQTGRAPGLATVLVGEDVVHAEFGDGLVTGLERDGTIVVRFAGDGSERKLITEYAPVTRR